MGEAKRRRQTDMDRLFDLTFAERARTGGKIEARAYQIRLAFQDLYEQPSTQSAAAFLKKWYFWVTHSRLEPMIEAAHMVKRHWDGILRWFHSKIANGLIEGINSLVQAAKAKARGYRSTRNLEAMVYLLAGKVDLRLPA